MADAFFDALPEYLELLIGYAPALFMVIVPAAVFIAWQKTKNETRKARESAAILGLSYSNVADEMKGEKPGDAFLLGLLSKWSAWAMEGTYNSVAVRVEQIVKSRQNRRIARAGDLGQSNPASTSYSRGITYDAAFARPLPFDVRVQRNSTMEFPFLKGPAREAIMSGDAELDHLAVVSGNDMEAVRQWLQSEHIQEGLKDVYRLLPAVTVSSDGLHYYELQGGPDYENIKKNLAILSGAARKLEQCVAA